MTTSSHKRYHWPSLYLYIPSEGQNVNPGYFGIDRPLDLAVLATDITEWDGAAGLKRGSIYKCLETIRFRLGDTLRARAWVSTMLPQH